MLLVKHMGDRIEDSIHRQFPAVALISLSPYMQAEGKTKAICHVPSDWQRRVISLLEQSHFDGIVYDCSFRGDGVSEADLRWIDQVCRHVSSIVFWRPQASTMEGEVRYVTEEILLFGRYTNQSYPILFGTEEKEYDILDLLYETQFPHQKILTSLREVVTKLLHCVGGTSTERVEENREVCMG